MAYSIPNIRMGVAYAADPQPLRDCAAAVMSRMQSHTPAVQLLGTAVALVAMSESLGLDPHEVVQRARRAVHDLEAAHTHQVQALRDYARGELTRTQA